MIGAKRILVTGASGFLGKVWLAHLLLETDAHLVLVLRPGRQGALARFEELLATSPAFRPLHDAYGDELGAVLAERLEVVAGDLATPLLGLESCEDFDLVVNLAGHTDLDPDLRVALDSNVRGALHALDVARRAGAPLLHVSTAYVAGARRGRIPEVVDAGHAPNGDPLDPARELADLDALVARTLRAADDQLLATERLARARGELRRLGLDPAGEAEFAARERERWITERLDVEARARAKARGWPNVYTYSKGLAEALLAEAHGAVPLWIVRPTIVESALAFPFPGWKEGLHTSGPLVYALTHGPLRGLPSRERLVLDTIPVDFVGRGLTVLSAALLAEARPATRVFHLGSSDSNPLPMKRVVELSCLAHRALEGRDRGPLRLRDLLVADAAPTTKAIYRATSVPLFRRLAAGAGDLLQAAAEVLPGDLAERSRKLARQADRLGRRLESLEEVVERFLPFVLENDCCFAADGIRELEGALSPAERARFAADPSSLDWRRYWIDVHVPGLRRWVYPRIEGRRPPTESRRPVRIAKAVKASS